MGGQYDINSAFQSTENSNKMFELYPSLSLP